MAVLREKLRKAEKAKSDAKSDASGKQASEPKTSLAESRLIRSQAEQDAATTEAMRHKRAQNLKRHRRKERSSLSSRQRVRKREKLRTSEKTELAAARQVAFVQSMKWSRERERRIIFENQLRDLQHDQAARKAASELFPTWQAGEEADYDYDSEFAR